MSDDIVTRLRILRPRLEGGAAGGPPGWAEQVCYDAIDEIERLRAPLPAGDDLVEMASYIICNLLGEGTCSGKLGCIQGGSCNAGEIARRVLAAITPAIEARGRDRGIEECERIARDARERVERDPDRLRASENLDLGQMDDFDHQAEVAGNIEARIRALATKEQEDV